MNPIEKGITNLPMTDLELIEVLDAFQFCAHTLKYMISQPTTPQDEKDIYATKLLYVEKVMKRLVDTINIGEPANDDPV